MSADPRCPSCDGKVSATATWCMHCGFDFDGPAGANAGDRGGAAPVERDASGEVTVSADATAPRDAAGDRDGVDRTSDGGREIDAARGVPGTEADSWEANPLVAFAPGDGGSTGSVLAPVFAFLDAGEWRLLSFVLAVCLGFLWLVGTASSAFAGILLVATAALGWVMFTRGTASETVAAGAAGAGLLALGIRSYDAARVAADDGVGAALDLLGGSRVGLLVALVLVLAGWYLDR